MWYFTLKVSPKPNTALSKEAGGAYVNCWINFREQDGAEHLAKFYLEQAGWDYVETQESRWVEKDDYADHPKGMQNFLEAENDSGSFVVQQWGLNGDEEK
jgi:hypothetical protein